MSFTSNQQSYYDSKYFAWQRSLGEFGGWANQPKFSNFIFRDDIVLDFGCGAGVNALDVLIQCDVNNLKVEDFLDSNIQIKEFQGYKVLQPQELLDSKSGDFL
jgi:hypothetical protein